MSASAKRLARYQEAREKLDRVTVGQLLRMDCGADPWSVLSRLHNQVLLGLASGSISFDNSLSRLYEFLDRLPLVSEPGSV